ncbi:hypothetical protein SAMN04487967_1596 [Natronorubrum sediminis]|uniref:Thaumarchaeal output domain-containing protein n=2 Tax=Natronorubrum sediminis TaxID=640943 RepID=A0A1H6FUG5_9EURY|nr:hypothetical protein [Natronorubrum sediminis]SEH14427.1 hypothetical protein SAMN04487967_1596 [Natronorubrum sediminis]
MVSPGELRLVNKLTEKESFEPEITDTGAVSYPDVTQLLDDADGKPADVLEHFASRDVLAGEFVSKVYICPECTTEGLQYTTVCPACEAPNATETLVLEHACGYAGPELEFDAGDKYHCPDCEMELQSEDVDETTRYVCNECTEIADVPDERLWCRECFSIIQTLAAIERVLYRYSLSPTGKQWLSRQKDARQTIAEALEERRFEIEIDMTVTTEATSQSVHVFAEDSMMGDQRVVGIYETPDTDRVDEFCEIANSLEAHPIVITTSGTVEEDVTARAESAELTLLAFDGDGTLTTEYDTVGSDKQGFLQRLTAAIDVPVRERQ